MTSQGHNELNNSETWVKLTIMKTQNINMKAQTLRNHYIAEIITHKIGYPFCYRISKTYTVALDVLP